MKIICVDIGNSSINIGFSREDEIVVQSIDAMPLQGSSDYGSLLNRFMSGKNIEKDFEGSIISSVVPELTGELSKALLSINGKEPLILTHKIQTGIRFQIDEPEKLGSDRIAESAGACDIFGSPVAVIDFGTATTVNFIDAENVYTGGAIMPGIGLMKKALHMGTSQLPDVDMSRPLSPLGKDTTGNILSGIIYGTAGAVERIISDVEEAHGERYKLVVTGGYHSLVEPFLKKRHYTEPALILKGLKGIYKRNS